MATNSADNSSNVSAVHTATQPAVVVIDSSYPYYLYPSDSPGMIFVNSLSDGKGYGGWHRAIVIALSAKNKLGFIDEIYSELDSSSTDFKQWNRCNDIVISWLLNFLSKDIAERYYTKVKRIWDELDTLNTCEHCTCECDCGGKSRTLKSLQDGRLIQFLMGLNDTYSAVRSNILMITPLPSVNQAYSLLIQDEKQRKIHVAQHPV
ncbi:uncharacterized protein [Nicotiana tomentosiformis]|uniref:uncharacterized protein n=1 Tax=Nicotiana tomentosiformis TaxID=4098 RepID=UPI00388CD9D4